MLNTVIWFDEAQDIQERSFEGETVFCFIIDKILYTEIKARKNKMEHDK